MNIDDYKATLDTGEIGEYFADYDSGYICDVISEIADNQISIYTADQIRFAFENDEWADQAICYGTAMDGAEFFKNRRASFRDYVAHVGAAAWYEKNCSDLYEHLEDNVRLCVCVALKDAGISEISDEQAQEIDFMSFDQDDRLEDAIARAMQLVSDADENEEE